MSNHLLPTYEDTFARYCFDTQYFKDNFVFQTNETNIEQMR